MLSCHNKELKKFSNIISKKYLVNDLENMIYKFVKNSLIIELDIIVIYSLSCLYCIKAYNDIIDLDILKYIDLYIFEDNNNLDFLDIKNLEGIPFFYSKFTKKKHYGYLSLEDVLNKLSY